MLRPAILLSALLLVVSALSSQAQTLAEVKTAYYKEDYKAAKALVDQLITTDPKNPEFNYWKGIIYIENEDLATAQAAFEEGIKKRKKYGLNHAGLARVYARKMDTANAHLALKTAMEVEPTNPEVMFASAQGYVEFGRCPIWKGADTISNAALKEAETILINAQSKFPEDPRSYVALGDYYNAKHVYELALGNYEDAIKKDPNYEFGYVRAGEIIVIEGKTADDFNKALGYFNKAIELDPNLAVAYKDRGDVFFRFGNSSKDPQRSDYYGKALEDYRKYVGLTSGDLRARVRFATFLFLKGEYDNCLNELKAIEAAGLKTNLMRRITAFSYFEKGQYDQARTALDEYFKEMPAEYQIAADFEYDGKMFLMKGDTVKAFSRFDMAIEKDVKRVVLYETLADTAKNRKEFFHEAKFRQKFLDMTKLKEQSPTLKQYTSLGLAYYRAKKYQEAETALRTIYPKLVETKSLFYIDLLAAAANSLDDDSLENREWRAKEYYEKYVQVAEANGLAEKNKGRMALAYAYLAAYFAYNQYSPEDPQPDCEAAKPYLEKALGYDPAEANAKALKEACAPATPVEGTPPPAGGGN